MQIVSVELTKEDLEDLISCWVNDNTNEVAEETINKLRAALSVLTRDE